MIGCKFGTEDYRDKSRKDPSFEQRVTSILEMGDEFYIIENVPARVDKKTGEQFFAPSTVECLQEPILGQAEPSKGSRYHL